MIDRDDCEICGEPLDESEPWLSSMDGMGAHHRCLRKAGLRLP